MKTVPEMLRESADTYEQRNKLYGNSYKEHGKIMMALFPNGVTLESEDDHNRWGVFNMMVSKLKRYAEQMDKQGHDDSLLDLSTYTSMLRELDEEIRMRSVAVVASSSVVADRVESCSHAAVDSAAIARAYEASRRPVRYKDASEVLPHITGKEVK